MFLEKPWKTKGFPELCSFAEGYILILNSPTSSYISPPNISPAK
jgi:hypothetical protein